MRSSFIELLLDSFKTYSSNVAIVDCGGDRKTTYNELYKLVCQVVSFLQSKNIPSQSFITIKLPNSLEYVASEIGIWLSGCAAVPLGANYPRERINYIVNHCDSPLTIDTETMTLIRKMPPSEKFVLPESTQNALILYTSGSTGTPKGVLHTYEPLDNAIPRSLAPGFSEEKIIFGASAPLYFAFGNNLWDVLHVGGMVHIYSDDIKNNVTLLEKYIYDHEINISVISPAVLTLFNNKSPKLKVVITAGEKLITQYSKDGYTLYNLFGQTEALHAIIGYRMPEHPLDKVPIGKCLHGIEAKVVDENNCAVPWGEVGEMCLRGPLFKEYYKEPEMTKEIFSDEWLHTKDLVYINEDDDIVYINRKDWMVKVNGQRVEPGEIETAMMKISGVKGVVVKGFDKKGGSQYLCAFYQSDNIEEQDLRNALSEKFPTYMIPSYFVKIDKFPLNANGKIDRKTLKEPDFNSYDREYAGPTNELEKSICIAFCKVLELSKVGIDDDFYLLGGDSIRTMKLQLLCDHLGVTSSIIYSERTPRKIASVVVRADDIGKSVPNEAVLTNNEKSKFVINTRKTTMVNSKKMYFVNLLLGILPNSGCQKFKTKLMRWAGVKVGVNVEIFQGCKIQGIGEVEIGNNVFIGHDVLILVNEGSKVIFEDNSGVSTRSLIITGFHPITPDEDRIVGRGGTCSTVRFCKGSGVSANCTILPNVTIGEKALVAAGTTVSTDVAPYSLVGSVPYQVHLAEGELKNYKD